MRIGFAAALIACGGAGEILVNIGPLFVGATAESYVVRSAVAGSVLTAELAAMALAALTVWRVIPALGVGMVAGAGVLGIILGNALAFVIEAFPIYVLARILCGAGSGALMAIGNTLIATTANPHRLYAAIGVAVGAIVLAMLPAVAPATSAFGPGGVYVVYLATGALLGICVLGLQWAPRRSDTPRRPPARMGVIACAAVFGFGLFFCADIGFWAYFERIGAERGLALAGITQVFMLNGIVGIGAPLLAGVIGLRWGFLGPYLVSVVFQIVGAFMLACGSSVWSYLVGSLAFSAGFMFAVPYLKWALALVDDGGRSLTAGMSALAIGAAIGPALLGWLAEWGGGNVAMAWAFTLMTGVASALVWPVTRLPQAVVAAATATGVRPA